MKTEFKFKNLLLLHVLILGLLLTTFDSFGQKSIGLVDSLQNSVKDIKEEITKLKDDYYMSSFLMALPEMLAFLLVRIM